MANRVFQVLSPEFSAIWKFRIEQVRHGHHLRGKAPTVARTLQQRLDLLKEVDPLSKVNIGLPLVTLSEKNQRNKRIAEIKNRKNNQELERLARTRQLSIDLDQAKQDWQDTLGPSHNRRIAEHYGIYQDLFGDAYFTPVVPLQIDYLLENDTIAKVYTGNVIKSIEACKPPNVTYKAEQDSLWTLIMTTPDGNMQNANNEYCHWFIGNIPQEKLDKGEAIVDYLRPIPAQGAGYYRYIFVLYKQEKHLDYSEYKKQKPCLELKERDWSTLEFYRKYQDDLTPAGLAFFQADYDPSVRNFYQTTLGMKAPVFQYDFPEPFVKPQTWFPIREAFNLYMDRYRDPKEINKEFLLRKLKNVHPFKEPKPPVKYPNVYGFSKYTPSWLKLEKTKSRLGQGRINNIN